MTTPADVRVREATPDDAATVDTLVREIAAHQDQSEHVATDRQAWRALLARPDVTVLLAHEGDEPVGYVSAVRRLHLWSGREVVALDDLYVRAGRRDHGVGLALMRALADRSGELTITWGVQPGNDAAIRFYERLGAATSRKVLCAWPADRR